MPNQDLDFVRPNEVLLEFFFNFHFFIAQAGFGQPGFGAFPAGGIQPGLGSNTISTGTTQVLDNRFGEDSPLVSGGSQTVTSQNGNFQSVTSVLKPNGQVVTTQQSGQFPKTT